MSNVVIKKAGSNEFSKFVRALIVGTAGSGKTVLANSFPEPLFITAGKNLGTHAKLGSNYVEINNENDLFDVKVGIQKGTLKCQTLVIDLIEDLQDVLFKQRFAAEKRDPWNVKSDDWNWLGAKVNGIFASLSELHVNIIVLSRTKDVGGYDGEQLVVKPNVIGSFANNIYDYVDYALLLERRGPNEPESPFEETTFLRTIPSIKYPWVFDRTGTLTNFAEVDHLTYSKFLESRKIAISPSSEQSLEVDILEPVKDDPKKETNIAGMSSQDKINQILKKK